MSPPRRGPLVTSLVAALIAVSTTAGPASARIVTVRDARDTAAGADITSVTYRNGETTAGATVHVRDLRRRGRLVLRIAPVDSDVMYVATARISADGSVARQLAYSTETSTHTRACAFDVTWSASHDYVKVTVPHRCLDFGRFLTKEWFRATMHTPGHSDAAASRNVGRGSSPGCATRAEMRTVHRGYTRARVAAILDTNGRFGDGAAGGYSRIYRNCGGGRGWYVDFDGDTRRVIDRGRVRG